MNYHYVMNECHAWLISSLSHALYFSYPHTSTLPTFLGGGCGSMNDKGKFDQDIKL